MSAITTHVLDAALGRPAAGVPVHLHAHDREKGWEELASAVTDDDGRVPELGPGTVPTGTYRLVFNTAEYFAVTERAAFYPEVTVTFRVSADGGHYHVPLLLSPFAYSTYRGS
jgi:5-hydroxyisourate hydrolase